MRAGLMAELMLGQHLASAAGATMQGALVRQVDVVRDLTAVPHLASGVSSARQTPGSSWHPVSDRLASRRSFAAAAT